MKRIVRLALLLLLSLPLAAAVHPIRNTVHTIEIHSATGEGACSATAVSPKTLLTATHCFSDTSLTYLTVDRESIVTVVKSISDDDDHTFLLLEGIRFTDIAKTAFNDIKIANRIYIYGNPLNIGRFYRVGVVSTFMSNEECPYGCALFQLSVSSGDSGAGIFKDGLLVGVITGHIEFPADALFYPPYAKKIMFTPEQIKEAISYGR